MDNSFKNSEPMLDMFIFETNQLLEQLEQIVLENDKNDHLSAEDINEIFRIMHTIKGSAAMMMFNNISELAHSVEDLFYFIREKKVQRIDSIEVIDITLSAADFIRNEISKIEKNDVPSGNADQIIHKIQDYLIDLDSQYPGQRKKQKEKISNYIEQEQKYYISAYQNTDNSYVKRYSVDVFFEDGCEMENIRGYTLVHNLKEFARDIVFEPEDIMENDESIKIIRTSGFHIRFSTGRNADELSKFFADTIFLKEFILNEITDNWSKKEEKKNIDLNDIYHSEKEAAEKDIKEPQLYASRHTSMISVSVKKLDMLMDLMGEIVISQAMVTKNPDIQGLELSNFTKAARQLGKLTNELQDIVMSIRMMPLSNTFHKMNRIVRDMSRKLGKDIQLKIAGEDTEVDKNIIDHLSDPLMHLIRNAMDHGIEMGSERIKLGKQEKGTITLEAKNAGRDVWITVKDDGKGLDKEKILNKAIAQGLVTRPENELSDREIFSFILLPGFSTKENVTEYSGRGVGLDVVKNNIEQIGGSISIESIPKYGTAINIKIPLTLAIIDGMEIGVGKSKYTVPITSIKESFKPDKKNVITDSDGNDMIMVRGECYPILRIHKIFKINTNATSWDEGVMVMVESDIGKACLFADQLIGEQQVVIKGLPNYLKRIRGIAGCTILGDGSMSLILDINGILSRCMNS